VVDLLGGPAADMTAATQEDFEQADDAGVVDLDRGIADPDGCLWIVPAERMKAGKEHRVPLSEAAMKIIEKMAAIRLSDYIFPGQRTSRPLSQMAMLMLLRRMGRGDLTAHGFRSTFSDWCAERTSFPSEVREMALAHTVESKIEAAWASVAIEFFSKGRTLLHPPLRQV
jgi:integrase